MPIETVLSSVMKTIPDCIAAGYIDMETGMLLGVQATEQQHSDTLGTLALAVANLFQGRGVTAFQALLNAAGSGDGEDTEFGEIAVFSNECLHIFLRTRDYPDHVVCFICRDSTNIGLALTKSHLGLGAMAEAV